MLTSLDTTFHAQRMIPYSSSSSSSCFPVGVSCMRFAGPAFDLFPPSVYCIFLPPSAIPYCLYLNEDISDSFRSIAKLQEPKIGNSPMMVCFLIE